MIFATLTVCPAVTFVPLSCTFPAPGNVVIFTANNVFAGLSLGSVNPKFAAVNVYCVSSFVVTVLFVPAGALFAAAPIVILTVLVLLLH